MLNTVKLAKVSPTTLTHCLGQSVNAAMYWQDPDGEDALTATEPMQAALIRVAEHIARSGLVAWWGSDLAPDQWNLTWERNHHQDRSAIAAETVSIRPWRQRYAANSRNEERDAKPNFLERLADVVAGRGPVTTGTWWSSPITPIGGTFTPLSSTRLLPSGEPALLILQEDIAGGNPAWARPLTPVASSDTGATTQAVMEIHSPEDWARLCSRFPFVVSHSRGNDWQRVTGHPGPWLIPDWSAVADHYAGVHLSVLGYLTAATRVIPVSRDGTDYLSLFAGWSPDQTFWFTDVTLAEPIRWRRIEDVWKPER